MHTNRIAEFDSSDDALKFAKWKGADYTVCAGIRHAWAVRPKSRREINYTGTEPTHSYVDEDREDEE